MAHDNITFSLTIVIATVSGKNSLRRCLDTLYPQISGAEAEIIVPFDRYSREVGEIASEFPEVQFYFIEDLGMAASKDVSAHQHRLYDRRRALGLQRARGKVVAMTEDHARPAADWCQQILAAHEQQPYAVIGGAIENAVERPLNRALYYCDFGRYGRPIADDRVEFVSDVNVSYKREALESVRETWQEAYHETNVHWALRKKGEDLFLDERIIVYQERPPISLMCALRERVEWGRVFAETRVKEINFGQRLMFAAGTAYLPLLLLFRAWRNMFRQRLQLKRAAETLPFVVVLLIGWSIGELLGYLCAEPPLETKGFDKIAPQTVLPQQPR
jgi:Glycosyl transferase family 2